MRELCTAIPLECWFAGRDCWLKVKDYRDGLALLDFGTPRDIPCCQFVANLMQLDALIAALQQVREELAKGKGDD